jgi:hypothetical protein
MQILRFNPQASVEWFQKLVQTPTSTEEEIKNAAFAALAKSSIEALTSGLSSDIVSKIQGYAKERADKISQFVRKHNALLDMEDELQVFKENKEAHKKAKQAYFVLKYDAPDFIQQFKTQEPLMSKRLEEFKGKTYQCVWQDPTVDVTKAMSALKEPAQDKFKNDEKITDLCKAIQRWYEYYNVKPSYDLKKKINFSDFPAFVVEIFEKQFPIAKEKAQEVQAKREAAKKEQIEICKKDLPASLSVYHNTKTKLESNENYQKYLQQQQEIKEMIKQLKEFCTSDEVINHAKISRESKDRLSQKFRYGFV